MMFKQPFKRIAEISHYARCARNVMGMPGLAVLGFARGHSFDGDDFISRVGRRLYPRLVVRPARFRGLKLYLNAADLTHLIIAEEFLIDDAYDLSRLPFVPDVVVDCGAHIGMFMLLAASSFPRARMICFEPNPRNVPWLRQQIDGNALDVELHEAAVTITWGEAKMSLPCSFGGSLVHGEGAEGDTVVVKTVRLADFLSSTNATSLLLKLDVEGEELKLFPDIVGHLPGNCAIHFETHGGEASWKSVAQLLEREGFSVAVARRKGACVDGSAVRVARTQTPAYSHAKTPVRGDR